MTSAYKKTYGNRTRRKQSHHELNAWIRFMRNMDLEHQKLLLKDVKQMFPETFSNK